MVETSGLPPSVQKVIAQGGQTGGVGGGGGSSSSGGTTIQDILVAKATTKTAPTEVIVPTTSEQFQASLFQRQGFRVTQDKGKLIATRKGQALEVVGGRITGRITAPETAALQASFARGVEEARARAIRERTPTTPSEFQERLLRKQGFQVTREDGKILAKREGEALEVVGGRITGRITAPVSATLDPRIASIKRKPQFSITDTVVMSGAKRTFRKVVQDGDRLQKSREAVGNGGVTATDIVDKFKTEGILGEGAKGGAEILISPFLGTAKIFQRTETPVFSTITRLGSRSVDLVGRGKSTLGDPDVQSAIGATALIGLGAVSPKLGALSVGGILGLETGSFVTEPTPRGGGRLVVLGGLLALGTIVPRTSEFIKTKIFESKIATPKELLSDFILIGEKGKITSPISSEIPLKVTIKGGIQTAFKEPFRPPRAKGIITEPTPQPREIQTFLVKPKPLIEKPLVELKGSSKESTQLKFKFPDESVAPKEIIVDEFEFEIPEIRKTALGRIKGKKGAGSLTNTFLLLEKPIKRTGQVLGSATSALEGIARTRAGTASLTLFPPSLRETQRDKVKSFQSLVLTTPIISKSETKVEKVLREKQKERERLSLSSISTTSQENIVESKSKLGVVTKKAQKQRRKQSLLFFPQLREIETTKIPEPEPPPPEEKIDRPKEEPSSTFRKKPSSSRLKDAYDVLIKEKGKLIKANRKGLPFNKAFNFGSEIVDNSTAASFRLKKIGKKTRKKDDLNLFRARKFTQKPNNRFVEKKRHRIDSSGELRGITAKGLLARRRKLKRTRSKKRRGFI